MSQLLPSVEFFCICRRPRFGSDFQEPVTALKRNEKFAPSGLIFFQKLNKILRFHILAAPIRRSGGLFP